MTAGGFSRIFIANRGEIAVRIVRACQKLGLESVVAVSAADRDSLAAKLATRSVCVGPAPATQSYLCAEALIMAAKATNCEAVHPGYGFLSERASFARECQEAGLVFIGPSPEAIEQMGDKVSALRLANEANVPCVPGSIGRVDSADDVQRIAKDVGYPVLIKASAGGGGRGMRIIRSDDEVDEAMRAAKAEAAAAFGDGGIYVEKYVTRARHIEIQVLADRFGKVVHLGERDCTVQRRHQKLIEEAPSPAMDETVRRELGSAAVALAKAVGYQGAGTVEFIFDEATSKFYFLEMNTRIQVEHPVTEMIVGKDLVVEQIQIAAGFPLSFDQEDVVISGHAIECRINAEDVDNDFAPSPGRIETWSAPAGVGIRLDTHCVRNTLISPYYDSLLGKLIVHRSDRHSAIEALQSALKNFQIEGVRTTIQLHQRILANADFIRGRITTRWLEEELLRDRNESAQAKFAVDVPA